MSFGSEVDAGTLFAALTADDTVQIPAIDLTSADFQIPTDTSSPWYQPIPKLTNNDLTSGTVDGTGTFDIVMRGYAAQLKEEYNKGRITGAEYTKAFIAMTQAALQFSVQFLLGRDQAYWMGVQAQVAAITARVQLETAKVQYAALQAEALNNKAMYALTKLKLSTEDANYGIAAYNLSNMMPQQLQIAIQQVAQSVQQVANLKEQLETTRAQTLDTRSDGTPVTGVMGQQKALYAQQITSYKRDAEVKAAKIFSDAWITMLTINESTPVPNCFTNKNLDNVLGSVQSNNNLSMNQPDPYPIS